MPYISMSRRKLYDEKVNGLCDSLRENSKKKRLKSLPTGEDSD